MVGRPSLGFGEDEVPADTASTKDPFDLSEFRPKAISRPDRLKVEEAAAKTQFKSREAKQPVVAEKIDKTKHPRRRRTGRSAQLNLKVRPETIVQFYALADAQGWVLGEAFEKAVLLLEREYGRQN
ncbi:MAG: stability/partitioning determinant [Shinella sp.]|nr:MAG: stability/partitioning determinant [Shinella sp.]